MKKTLQCTALLLLLLIQSYQPSTAFAQGTAFTYQGRLNTAGSPANGLFDFQFALSSAPGGGSQVGSTVTKQGVGVTNGLFTTTLDFGAVFAGNPTWLAINVRTNGAGSYAGLTPLQPLLPTPYAIVASSASNLLGALPAAQLSGTLQSSSLPASPNFSGTVTANAFTGVGTGLTGLNPANLSAGTAGINISGNAATATTATSANSATTAGSSTTATTANNFSGALAGDVTGTQGATVVSTVGSVTAANVAGGANAANAATSAATANTIVKRDGSGNFSAGTITANLAGNAATATTAANVTGNIADAQLSANIARLNGANAFTGTNTFAGVTMATNVNNVIAGTFTGDGSGLTGLNPANLSAGTAGINISGNAATATTATSANSATTAGSATTATTANNFSGTLAGDVTGTQGATVVSVVGGVAAANVAGGANAANAATSANTANAIVNRDASGNFSAGTITASLNGNAATATTATSANSATTAGSATTATTANNFSGALLGDVTGTQVGTVVSTVGGVTAANVAGGANAANAATSANTASAIVKRDGSGNFSAGTVTAGGFTGPGANVTGVNAANLNGLGAANFWQTGGNAGTTPGVNFLGTTDNQPLEFHVNGQRALRLEPANNGFDQSINVIAGSPFNFVAAGVVGATIAGGGATNSFLGGEANSATANFATVGGGYRNTASGSWATIAGGNSNGAGNTASTVGGGAANNASGDTATIAGGYGNTASGLWATVAGGDGNHASGQASIAMGDSTTASGINSTAMGNSTTASGQDSFAAGNQAQALNDGSFVWADHSSSSPFASTATNQFLIRAKGGVGIGTTTPVAGLDVEYSPAGVSHGNWGYLQLSGYANNGGGGYSGSPNLAIYTSGAMGASTYYAFSDARIKNIIGVSSGEKDLKTLRGIEVTDYTYKDTVANGGRLVKKVIAQQVESVYPQAVSQTTGVVPDIFQPATQQDGWVKLATNLKVGERVKLVSENGQGIYQVIETRDGAFRTDFKPATDKIFVYGREVNDFRNVDYEALTTLNVSATQELAKKLDAQQAALAKLQDQLNRTLAEKETLLKHLAALEARDQEREDRLAQIERNLEQSSVPAKYAALNLH